MIALIIFCKTRIHSQLKLKEPPLFYKQALLKEWEKLELFKKMAQKEVPDLSFYTALVYNGKIVSEKKMGYAYIQEKIRMDRKMVHKCGSVSKLFTTVAILQLVERKKLKLTDHIVQFFSNLGKKTEEFEKNKTHQNSPSLES